MHTLGLLLLVSSDQLPGSCDHVPGGRLRPLSAVSCLGGTLLSNSKFFQIGGFSLLVGISQCMFSVM